MHTRAPRVSQLAAVVDQVAAGTGEFVCLARQNADGELFGGQVGPRQIQLGLEGVDLVTEVHCRICAASLQGFQALLLLVVCISRARRVVVSRHAVISTRSFCPCSPL